MWETIQVREIRLRHLSFVFEPMNIKCPYISKKKKKERKLPWSLNMHKENFWPTLNGNITYISQNLSQRVVKERQSKRLNSADHLFSYDMVV